MVERGQNRRFQGIGQSRNNMESIELAIQQQLVGDLARQKCRTMAIASVDMHMCYDCIAHLIASICFQWWNEDFSPIITIVS